MGTIICGSFALPGGETRLSTVGSSYMYFIRLGMKSSHQLSLGSTIQDSVFLR